MSTAAVAEIPQSVPATVPAAINDLGPFCRSNHSYMMRPPISVGVVGAGGECAKFGIGSIRHSSIVFDNAAGGQGFENDGKIVPLGSADIVDAARGSDAAIYRGCSRQGIIVANAVSPIKIQDSRSHPTKAGEKFGRNHRYTLTGVGFALRQCSEEEVMHRYKYRSSRQTTTPRFAQFHNEQWSLAYCDAIALGEGAALMSAKELADWLRARGELPMWSRSTEQNLRTPSSVDHGRQSACYDAFASHSDRFQVGRRSRAVY